MYMLSVTMGAALLLLATRPLLSVAPCQETIAYRITQKHSNYNEAEIMEVLECSPERNTPPCRHFGVCGGCSLQHMNDDMQMQLKQNTLLDQLKHFGKVSPETIIPRT